MLMRGYRRPLENIRRKPQEEDVLVGCRRCMKCWYEKRMMYQYTPRINGPMLDYDYCDNCITDNEKKEHGVKDV